MQPTLQLSSDARIRSCQHPDPCVQYASRLGDALSPAAVCLESTRDRFTRCIPLEDASQRGGGWNNNGNRVQFRCDMHLMLDLVQLQAVPQAPEALGLRRRTLDDVRHESAAHICGVLVRE